MKKRNHLFLPRLALVSLGLLLLLSIACEKKDSPEKKSEQAVSTSAPAAVASPAVAEAKSTPSPSVPKDGANPRFFAAQENLLDAGGSFYLYADLQDVLKEEMQSVRNSIKGMPDAVEVERGLEITDRVIDLLGLYGLQDVGISSIPDGGLYRTKMFLNNTAGKDKGYMALLGDAPHALKILDRASSGTVLLYSADVNEMATWELIRGLVMNIGGGAALADMEKGLEELAKNEGIDIPKLLPTLGGEINV
ncbi:TPA: hypothetical protein DDW35_08005, partial [Candidatus Sumerlaeota bacterium]|nr:hypothetical protein [Candidatus Sumerlaeota bacterium]